MNLENLQAIRLEPGEHMVIKFRKHWFVLLTDTLSTVLAAFVPVVFFAALGYIYPPARELPTSLTTFVTLWWLLMVWLALSVIWTNYYLDLWMVTDKRLVSVDQTGLFYREVTTLPLSNVQDVTVEQYGLIATLLGFGNVTVQTAGPTTNNMTIRGVARPNEIRNIVVKQCELSKQRAQEKRT